MQKRIDVLACYDVETISPAGQARLRRMSKTCVAFGQRVQYSVFELKVTPAILERFIQQALKVMDTDRDSLRVYILNGGRDEYLRVYGRDGWVDFEGPLIV